jgi:hypothetical protein
MRQHLSFFLLTARGITGKFLLLLLAVIAIEAALGYRALGLLADGALPPPDWLADRPLAQGRELLLKGVETAGMSQVFLVACAILSVLLAINFPGRRGDSHVAYTLNRLSLSHRPMIFWHSLYNGLCLLILWGIQAILALTFCRLALSLVDPALVDEQTLFLVFRHDSFLNNLLPFAVIPRLVRNTLLVVSFSMTLSVFPYPQYQSPAAGGIGFFLLFTTFSTPPELSVVFWLFLLSILTLACLIMIWKEPSYDLVDRAPLPAGD